MKTIIRVVLVLLLAAGACIVVTNQKAIAAARADQQALIAEDQEANRLAEENKGIAQLREANGEWQKLREENKELPKLRNQVRQLRRQIEEVAKLRAENQQMQTRQKNGARPGAPVQLPPGYITRGALADVGLGTPEAALQTMLWSMVHSDLKRIQECATPEMAEKMLADGGEKFRKEAASMAQSFPGYRISQKTEVSPDEVIIEMEVVAGSGAHPLHLKRIGNEWKLSGE